MLLQIQSLCTLILHIQTHTGPNKSPKSENSTSLRLALLCLIMYTTKVSSCLFHHQLQMGNHYHTVKPLTLRTLSHHTGLRLSRLNSNHLRTMAHGRSYQNQRRDTSFPANGSGELKRMQMVQLKDTRLTLLPADLVSPKASTSTKHLPQSHYWTPLGSW